MKFTFAVFHDPEKNGFYGTLAVAATLYFYAYSLTYAAVGVVITYVLWLPLLAMRPSMLKLSWVEGILMVLPAYLLLSSLWSADPMWTLRASIQFATTILCALIAARCVSLVNMLMGMVLSGAIVGVQAYFEGIADGWDIQTDGGLVGYLGSKNQLGLNVSLGIIAAMILVGLLRTKGWRRIVALLLAAVCAIVLWFTDSVTSYLATGVALSLMVGLTWLRRLDTKTRRTVLPWAVTFSLGIIIAAWVSIPSEEAFETLGRDETMSGRTELFDAGLEAAAKAPALGYGFQGFWREGNPLAERLWDAYDIPEKTGFHFHNMFMQVLVDLGVVGLILFLSQIVWRIAAEWSSHFSGRISRRMTALSVILVYFLVRTISEVDYYYQFQVGSFLMMATNLKVAAIPGKLAIRLRPPRKLRGVRSRRRMSSGVKAGSAATDAVPDQVKPSAGKKPARAARPPRRPLRPKLPEAIAAMRKRYARGRSKPNRRPVPRGGLSRAPK